MKRGLSDIVTTVLIILLVVAAVVVIWGFIRPTLDQAGKSIQKGATCINNYIEPVTCKIQGDGSGTKPYNLTVGVKRVTDSGIVESVKNLLVATEFSDGAIETNTTALTAPSTNGGVNSGVVMFSQAFAISSSRAPRRVAVTAELTLKDGSVQVCPGTSLECTGGPALTATTPPVATSLSAVLQFATSSGTVLTGSSPPGSPLLTLPDGGTCNPAQLVGGSLQAACTFPGAGSYRVSTSAFQGQAGATILSYSAQTVPFTLGATGGTVVIRLA